MARPHFAGRWFTSFGHLDATDDDGDIQGRYEHKGGVLTARRNGSTITGTWAEGARQGPATLTLDEHGNTFSGEWRAADGSHGPWSGVRLDLLPEGEGGSPGAWNSFREGPLLAGPMIGEVSDRDAFVWAQARDTSPLTLIVRGPDGREQRVEATPLWDEWLCVTFRVDGLSPETRYRYTLESAGGETAERSFQTSPTPDARRLRVTFGSCFWDFPNPRLGIFDAIRAEESHVFVMAGDNAYYDTPDWQSVHTRMLAQLRHRNSDKLRRLVAGVSTLMVWDDHDFGPNDADSRFAGADESFEAFARVSAQRSYGLPGARGIFSDVRMGPVHLFLLDSRSHRINRQRILGDAQLEWLLDGLASSDAPIKLIVSGSQVLPEAPAELGWESFALDAKDELDRLIRGIESRGVEGALIASGDVHLGYLICAGGPDLGDGRTGPDLWEITSSPLANEVWHETILGKGIDDPFILEEIEAQNYGVIDVDLDRPDREIILTLKGTRGETLAERAVALATLRAR